jgi:repressor LexA
MTVMGNSTLQGGKMSPRKNKTFKERCDQVYDFFMDYYFKNDMSPTFSEIVKGTGIQRGNLHVIIKHLMEEGRLGGKSEVPRGLLPGHILGSLPLHWAGHIAANSLNPLVVLDLQDRDTTVEVPRHLLPRNADYKSLYVLQVTGDSMSEANILDGDYVVMQSGDTYQDYDILAVMLKEEGAVTLKMLEPTERGSIKVKPKSPRHQTRIEDPENIIVQGRVVAVMRKC